MVFVVFASFFFSHFPPPVVRDNGTEGKSVKDFLFVKRHIYGVANKTKTKQKSKQINHQTRDEENAPKAPNKTLTGAVGVPENGPSSCAAQSSKWVKMAEEHATTATAKLVLLL